MKPVIKWPGGKSGEIQYIENFIPSYERYIEPFFGGGAVYFHLQPQEAAINDVSSLLMNFYSLIKKQSCELKKFLLCYNESFQNLIHVCNNHYEKILCIYNDAHLLDKKTLEKNVYNFLSDIRDEISKGFACDLVIDYEEFYNHIKKMVVDKFLRTHKNNEKKAFSEEDLKCNLITGFTSGYYMYFRKIYNDLNLKKMEAPSLEYQIANFYFIREYCYGSMFRYNKDGEFNIPYGGISYNKKNLSNKIELMFNSEIAKTLKNTDIYNQDFEDFLNSINVKESDFMFLDPPYDTDFSDYEGREFTQKDQYRLSEYLKKTSAKFILVIKNTDYIYSLYKDNFNILAFDNQYTYNVRSRNERNVEHLIITNLPIK